MKKLFRYSLLLVGIIIVILLVTNPSPTEFKNHLYATEIKEVVDASSYGRIKNAFLWSVYGVTIVSQSPFPSQSEYYHWEYYGILNNFILTGKDLDTEEKLRKRIASNLQR